MSATVDLNILGVEVWVCGWCIKTNSILCKLVKELDTHRGKTCEESWHLPIWETAVEINAFDHNLGH